MRCLRPEFLFMHDLYIKDYFIHSFEEREVLVFSLVEKVLVLVSQTSESWIFVCGKEKYHLEIQT